jgi:hypothetical protein
MYISDAVRCSAAQYLHNAYKLFSGTQQHTVSVANSYRASIHKCTAPPAAAVTALLTLSQLSIAVY